MAALACTCVCIAGGADRNACLLLPVLPLQLTVLTARHWLGCLDCRQSDNRCARRCRWGMCFLAAIHACSSSCAGGCSLLYVTARHSTEVPRTSVMHVGLCFEASGRSWWSKGLLHGCFLQVSLQCNALQAAGKLRVYVCAHSSAQLGRWLLSNMVMPAT